MKYQLTLFLLCFNVLAANLNDMIIDLNKIDKDYSHSSSLDSIDGSYSSDDEPENDVAHNHQISKKDALENTNAPSCPVLTSSSPNILETMTIDILREIFRHLDYFNSYNLLSTSKKCRQIFRERTQRITTQKTKHLVPFKTFLIYLLHENPDNDVQEITIDKQWHHEELDIIDNDLCSFFYHYGKKLKKLHINTQAVITSGSYDHYWLISLCSQLEHIHLGRISLPAEAFTQAFLDNQHIKKSFLDRLPNLTYFVIEVVHCQGYEKLVSHLKNHTKLTTLGITTSAFASLSDEIILDLPPTITNLTLGNLVANNQYDVMSVLHNLPLKTLTLNYYFDEDADYRDNFTTIFKHSSLTCLNAKEIQLDINTLHNIGALNGVTSLSLQRCADDNSSCLNYLATSLKKLAIIQSDDNDHFIKNPNIITSLEHLTIVNTRPEYDDCIEALSTKFINLRKLDLVRVKCSKESLSHLTNLNHLEKLTIINNTDLSPSSLGHVLNKLKEKNNHFTVSYKKDRLAKIFERRIFSMLGDINQWVLPLTKVMNNYQTHEVDRRITSVNNNLINLQNAMTDYCYKNISDSVKTLCQTYYQNLSDHTEIMSSKEMTKIFLKNDIVDLENSIKEMDKTMINHRENYLVLGNLLKSLPNHETKLRLIKGNRFYNYVNSSLQHRVMRINDDLLILRQNIETILFNR